MNVQVLFGGFLVLGILGIWNTYTLVQVNERLDAIEQQERSTSKAEKNVAASKRVVPRQRSRRGTNEAQNNSAQQVSADAQRSAQPTIDLMDPEIQKKIAKIAESNAQKKAEQRRNSKREAYDTSIKYELEKFSKEKQYDAETVQSMEAILNDSAVEWRAVREQVREGEISWIDARTEFKAIGEEVQKKATALISEEDYKELRTRLWGNWGR